jgi:collagenase-like PrtC family protease
MKLSVGPLLYLWERNAVLRFYELLCEAPVDIVYIGEVVCSKRRLLRREDWRSVAGMLRSAGKEVVISTLALIEAESELSSLARTVESADTLVEANDYACVECLAGRPFVAGPHLNVYNEATLELLARHGARRWVAPVELPLAIVAALAELRPPGLEIEMFAYGRLPLAFSARCFTARSHHRAKDDCYLICAEDPDGTTVYTREGQPFLTLNGIQTQSAAIQNLLPHLPKLRNAGVDIVRLSPHSKDFLDVVQAFRTALLGGSATLPPAFLPAGYCDGYLDGAAGIAHAASRRPTPPATPATRTQAATSR